MKRIALLVSALSLTVAATVPAFAKAAAQADKTAKPAKIKKVKTGKGAKPSTAQTTAQPGEPAGTQVAGAGVGRVGPVAAGTSSHFFATPLGLLTAAGVGGGAVTGAAVLASQGAGSSPS